MTGDFNENLNLFYLNSTSMSHVQPEKKKLLYSTHKGAYEDIPRPPFGKSHHNAILLIPAYKHKLNQEVLVDSCDGPGACTLTWSPVVRCFL